jgi:hypothetical protein
LYSIEENPSALQPQGGSIKNNTNVAGEARGGQRLSMELGRVVLLLMFAGLAIQAWSQQTSPGKDASIGTAAPGATGAQSVQDDINGSIQGVVTSEDGTAYEGARIALRLDGASESTARIVIADSAGGFSFADVTPGGFQLTITGSGFAPRVITGVLHPGEHFDTRAIVLHVSATSSDVRVNATQEEISQEVMELEEHQRVLGFIPNFYVVYEPNAPPLSRRQKYSLAWRTAIDPITILGNGAISGAQQAENAFPGYGQGAQGYAKRFGANYADEFIGTMLGGAVLPSVFKQDPRYFYKGTGSIRSRALYAIANAVICKGDNGRWQADYSAIVGSLAAGGISNLYYPASSRHGATLTFEGTFEGFGYSAIQNLFQEFVVKKLTPHLPGAGAKKP